MTQAPLTIRQQLMPTGDVFRAREGRADPDKVYLPRPTPRAPGNVPYLVDNLWAWTRPGGYPDRRQAAFASPSPERAVACAGEGGGMAHRVVFEGAFTLAQLQAYEDARYHPDCYRLKKLVVREVLGTDWLQRSPAKKQPAGRLFLPCLRAEEVEDIVHADEVLRAARERMCAAVTFWSDVVLVDDPAEVPDPEGELFFAYPGGYRLVPLLR